MKMMVLMLMKKRMTARHSNYPAMRGGLILSPSTKGQNNMKEHYMTTKGEYQRNGRHRWVKIMVSGEIFNTVFGIREEPIPNDDVLNEVVDTGWRITHIPTGHLILDNYFATLDDAKRFCVEVENLYGHRLQAEDVALYQNNRYENEDFMDFYKKQNRMEMWKDKLSFERAMKL